MKPAPPRQVDTDRAKALEAQQQRLIFLQNEFAKQKLVLARATGLPLEQQFELTDKVPYAALEPMSLDAALTQAYQSRADLKASQALVRAAEDAKRAAQGERLPSLGVSADIGKIGPSVDAALKTYTVAAGVHVYLPDDRTGLAEVVQAAVLGGKAFAVDAKHLASYQAVADAVIADPGGIGIVPLPSVSGARAVPIADRDDPPLMPTAFTVASEDYLLTHRLYFYTAQSSGNPAVARFVRR